MTYVATPVINIPSKYSQSTPTGQSTRQCIGIDRDINTPTQLINNVMTTQVHTHACPYTHTHTHTHTHTQYPYNTRVSLNTGRAMPQYVFDVVENYV